MAERGVDRSADDNPFSFKAFINCKEDKIAEKDIFSDDEEEPKPSPANTVTASSSTQELSKEDLDFDFNNPDANSQTDKSKDNPFSFKKFLSSSSSASVSSASATTTTKPKPKTPSSFHAPPDVASDIPLFTNNYFEEIHNSDTANLSTKQPTCTLTDVTITKTKTDSVKKKKQDTLSSRNKSNDSLKNSHKDIRVDNNSSLQLPLFDDSDDEFESEDTRNKAANKTISPSGLQLPDFLSDGPLVGGKPTMPLSISRHDDRNADEDEDMLTQIRALQEENRKLQDNLTRMKQKYEDKSKRIIQLKRDLEQQKKKEAEETAVMEKAVLQVEENLVTTTKRAVQAESAVSKLKQEVKGLQNQVRLLTAENEAYKSGDGGLSDIRERTKYTSEQLQLGAETAEKSLKDLMQGVEKMKLLSQVLASWEKITEVKPDSEESQS